MPDRDLDRRLVLLGMEAAVSAPTSSSSSSASRVPSIGEVAESMNLGSKLAAAQAEFELGERLLGNPTPELLSALGKAMAAMPNAAKSGRNDHDRYSYATLEDFLDAIRQPCLDAGLVPFSRVVSQPQWSTASTKSGGTLNVARVLVEARVYHAATGAWLAVRVWGEGSDRADKAVYKAITGGRKYSLALLFGIYTTDDPEADSDGRAANGVASRPSPAPPRPPAAPPTPAAPPAEARPVWTDDQQAKLLEKIAAASPKEGQSALEAMQGVVDYVLGVRAKGATGEQFRALCAAALRRADTFAEAGQISEAAAMDLVQKVTAANAPAMTAAQMEAAQAGLSAPTPYQETVSAMERDLAGQPSAPEGATA